MTDPRTQLVAATYEAIADRFAEWQDGCTDDPRGWWREQLMSRLHEGARVLELGCGAGLLDTRVLAERFAVTGVDISAAQIARARTNVAAATFIHADLTELELEPESFDAVASFFVFNHVPRDLLGGLFERIHRWLVPSGLFLVSLGASDLPDWTGEWLGTTTFFSGFPPDTNRSLLTHAGFHLELDEVVTVREPEGDVRFHWILGRT
jgi:cyclopropane fatty-acyl-phospholipid synthase-like methyltransferase